MALLTTQAVTLSGVQVSLAAVAASDTFQPGDNVFLWVNNGGGSPDTVALVTPATSRGLAVADAGGSVTNGTAKVFGPFPAALFADPTTGLVTVTHSFTTSVTSGVFAIQSI